MFGRPHYQTRYDWVYYQSVGQCPIPEPSTIAFLGLGALVVLGSRKYWKDKHNTISSISTQRPYQKK